MPSPGNDTPQGGAPEDPQVVMVTPSVLRSAVVRYAFNTACLTAARVALAQSGNSEPTEEYLVDMADELLRWLDLDKRLGWACFETEREWLARQLQEAMPS